MAFRDDREALRTRAELLQAELARVRGEAEALRENARRTRELERELAEAHSDLDELLATERKPLERRRPMGWIVTGTAIGALIAVTSVVLVSAVMAPGRTLVPPLPPTAPIPPPAWGYVSPPPFAPIAFVSRAEAVIGRAPVREGTECHVLIVPSEIPSMACRLTVRCNGEIVFGGEGLGYLSCNVSPVDGWPTAGADTRGLGDEGDPMLTMDLPDGTFVVSNDRPETWSFKLDVPTEARGPMAAEQTIEPEPQPAAN